MTNEMTNDMDIFNVRLRYVDVNVNCDWYLVKRYKKQALSSNDVYKQWRLQWALTLETH